MPYTPDFSVMERPPPPDEPLPQRPEDDVYDFGDSDGEFGDDDSFVESKGGFDDPHVFFDSSSLPAQNVAAVATVGLPPRLGLQHPNRAAPLPPVECLPSVPIPPKPKVPIPPAPLSPKHNLPSPPVPPPVPIKPARPVPPAVAPKPVSSPTIISSSFSPSISNASPPFSDLSAGFQSSEDQASAIDPLSKRFAALQASGLEAQGNSPAFGTPHNFGPIVRPVSLLTQPAEQETSPNPLRSLPSRRIPNIEEQDSIPLSMQAPRKRAGINTSKNPKMEMLKHWISKSQDEGSTQVSVNRQSLEQQFQATQPGIPTSQSQKNSGSGFSQARQTVASLLEGPPSAHAPPPPSCSVDRSHGVKLPKRLSTSSTDSENSFCGKGSESKFNPARRLSEPTRDSSHKMKGRPLPEIPGTESSCSIPISSYPWFHGDISHEEATKRLNRTNGCFLVRKTQNHTLAQPYSISLYADKMWKFVIVKNDDGTFSLGSSRMRERYSTVAEIVEHHKCVAFYGNYPNGKSIEIFLKTYPKPMGEA